MKEKLLGLLAVGLLADPTAANAISGTWYFSAQGASTTYTGQFSFTDLDPLNAYLNSQGAGFTFSANFPMDGIGGVGFNYDASGILEIGGLADDVNGYAPGDFYLAMLDFPAAATFLNFANADDDIYDGMVSSRPIPAPEPGTLALVGLGLAGLGLSRRRQAN